MRACECDSEQVRFRKEKYACLEADAARALVVGDPSGVRVRPGDPFGSSQGHVRRGVAGVTVEAASSVLIEKVRTAMTDSSGQYRLPELPPGPYALTFTLPDVVDQ